MLTSVNDVHYNRPSLITAHEEIVLINLNRVSYQEIVSHKIYVQNVNFCPLSNNTHSLTSLSFFSNAPCLVTSPSAEFSYNHSTLLCRPSTVFWVFLGDITIYSVSQKKSPLRGPDFFHFFHKRLRIFNRFFTHLL